MSVIKTMRECYEIREDRRGGEWANITLRCWDNPPPAGSSRGPSYGGEIAIHSSFGAWGYNWSSCGVPFKPFLVRAEFSYLFDKFMGASLQQFDGPATLKQIRADILAARQCGDVGKDEARKAWGAVSEEVERLTGDATDYGYAMFDVARDLGFQHPMHDYFADPCGWPRVTHHDIQAQGFWRTLWPLFVEALNAEESTASTSFAKELPSDADRHALKIAGPSRYPEDSSDECPGALMGKIESLLERQN